ncbi:MAG: endonuclease/exonuclease/phosphatase family metal-dependent hydrolase [Cognaticolwellia sp.]|jgi:endonuclease/exonuclease/phosphatase family metal-dependent hydrolase
MNRPRPVASPEIAVEPAASGPKSLTLMSWNVEWLDTAGEGMVPRTQAELDEMAQVIAKAAPDVVLLQEVASENAARELLPKGGWTLYVEDRKNDQRVVIGVREGLTSRGHPDQRAVAVGNSGLRYGVDVEVETATGPLRVLGVHLKAGCQWDPLQGKAECEVLGKQADAIEDWVDARYSEGVHVVVMGDFNRQMHQRDAFFLGLNDGDPAGLRLSLGPQKSEACEPNRRQTIDHIVSDAGRLSASRQIPLSQPPLSDHCPILAELEL